jgi:hypothetical protein
VQTGGGSWLKINSCFGHWSLEIGYYLIFVFWCLGFAIPQ